MHLYVISVIAERLALAGISQNRWLTDAQFSLSELTETQFLTAQQVNRLALRLSNGLHNGSCASRRSRGISHRPQVRRTTSTTPAPMPE